MQEIYSFACFFTGLASCTIEQNGRKNAIDMVQKGCLKDKELRMDDIMFGLTEKIFGVDYYIIKTSIYRELKGLARQIGTYLELPQGMIYLN